MTRFTYTLELEQFLQHHGYNHTVYHNKADNSPRFIDIRLPKAPPYDRRVLAMGIRLGVFMNQNGRGTRAIINQAQIQEERI